MLKRTGIFLCNLLWAVSCFPAWLRFAISLRNPRRAQESIRRRLATERMGTSCINTGGEEPATTTYNDYRSAIIRIMAGENNVLTRTPVVLLEPTSGSSATPKLIPCTTSLMNEFHNAISPWIFSLYLKRPGLLLCRHYWSISPSSAPVATESKVAVGFASDAEYLGFIQQHIARRLFPVPHEVCTLRNPEEFWFATALILAAEPDLGLISVWHPSFLRILIETISARRDDISTIIGSGSLSKLTITDERIRNAIAVGLRRDPERAAQVARFTPELLNDFWPRLQIISCWDQGRASCEAMHLQNWFPNRLIQGKGLLATEGIVTIPWNGHHVAAARSHYLEFQEPDGGRVFPLYELTPGKEYLVLLTTGSGFVRYRLGDRVRCIGFASKTPMLEFIGREGGVCDLAGEKLSPVITEQAISAAEAGMPLAFAMLAPNSDGDGYTLYFEDFDQRDPQALACSLEQSLMRNSFHYAHAYNLGQLRPVVAMAVTDGFAKYRAALISKGMKPGDIKALPLHPASDWREIFTNGI